MAESGGEHLVDRIGGPDAMRRILDRFYRKLAEEAVNLVASELGCAAGGWTAKGSRVMAPMRIVSSPGVW